MLGTICVSDIVSVWWNIFTSYFIGSQRMKSFLYFFCGTSVHYERRFLLICSTTRKVRTYIWKLDFVINLRALERERDEKDVGVFSWYLDILFETVFIFLSTRKAEFVFLSVTTCLQGVMYVLSILPTQPHNPFLYITFYILPFMDTLKEGASVWNLWRPWRQGWLLFSLQ